MLRNLIILPDGTEFYSGNGLANNVRSATITKCVNSDTELTLGSVCSAMLECKLQTPGGGLNIAEGTDITLYKVDDSGTRHKVGFFTMEKPTRSSAHTYKITAYDRVSWLDKDLTNWLAALDGWPYTVSTFAQLVCEACGLTLATTEFLNGDYEIQQFIGDGITGRQLMKWIGEIEAKFVRANANGEIELGWYGKSEKTVSPNGDIPYISGQLSYEDYRVQPIERVQIRLTGDDVGVVYPESENELNTYAITGNYLLTTTNSGLLEPVAKNIYEAIKDFTYTPCEVKIWANLDIDVGQIIDITDSNGKTITACVMSMVQSGQSQTLECTGSPRRDSSTVVNNLSMGALNAKMLEVKRDISGLEIKATNIETTVEENQKTTQEQIAAVQIRADKIESEVSSKTTDLQGQIKVANSKISQTADTIAAEVRRATDAENELSSKISINAGNIESTVIRVGNNETAIANVKQTADVVSSEVSKKVGSDEIISKINQSAEAISISASKIALEGLVTANSNFKILTDGSIEANNASISGKITATSGRIGGWNIASTAISQSHTTEDGSTYDVHIANYNNDNADSRVFHTSLNGTDTFAIRRNGQVNCTNLIATGGKIGGWSITSGKISGGDSDTGVAVMQAPSANINWVFAAGGTSHTTYGDCPFRVSKAGAVYASNISITGGSMNISGSFKVSSSGVLTCTGANISGKITATSGTFTGTVSGSTITGGSISIGENFAVDTNGNLTARSGSIGGWNISSYLSGYDDYGHLVTIGPSGVNAYSRAYEKYVKVSWEAIVLAASSSN